ncbi:MAG: hypothetical protein KY475_19980 [Planctomycetes bacterium]|nr:hypothetical protein [Planctomycetota bacterium]
MDANHADAIRRSVVVVHLPAGRWSLVVRGVACQRRAGKLYLPPGAKYFGCRTCHDLTYRSSQEAHQAERLFAQLGMPHDPAVVRMMFR